VGWRLRSPYVAYICFSGGSRSINGPYFQRGGERGREQGGEKGKEGEVVPPFFGEHVMRLTADTDTDTGLWSY